MGHEVGLKGRSSDPCSKAPQIPDPQVNVFELLPNNIFYYLFYTASFSNVYLFCTRLIIVNRLLWNLNGIDHFNSKLARHPITLGILFVLVGVL